MEEEKEIEDSFFLAVLNRNDGELTALLRHHARRFNPEQWEGRSTPLHIAAFIGWTEGAMSFLVLAPVLADVKDEAGQQPFEVARDRGFSELANSLENIANSPTYIIDEPS